MFKLFAMFSILTGLFLFNVGFGQGSASKPEAEKMETMRLMPDKAHTNIGFKVTHMLLAKVRGEFKDYSIDFNWDKDSPENSTVEVRIKTASIFTDNEKRDGHLKSPDFFDAQSYPEITFVSEKIEAKGDNKYVAYGDLTMRGITKKIELPFVVLGVIQEPTGKTRVGIEAELVLNRFDYNIKWDKTFDTGGLVVGEEVNVEIQAEFVSSTSS
jgi:polyisoprenoid-binding protein YceI